VNGSNDDHPYECCVRCGAELAYGQHHDHQEDSMNEHARPVPVMVAAVDDGPVIVAAYEPTPFNVLGSVALLDVDHEPFIGLAPDQARQLAAHLIAAAERIEPYQLSAGVRPLR
jgi:hypothetical protein